MILVEMFMETNFEILAPGEKSYTLYCENDHICTKYDFQDCKIPRWLVFKGCVINNVIINIPLYTLNPICSVESYLFSLCDVSKFKKSDVK